MMLSVAIVFRRIDLCSCICPHRAGCDSFELITTDTTVHYEKPQFGFCKPASMIVTVDSLAPQVLRTMYVESR